MKNPNQVTDINGVVVPRWIPVKEQLPELNTRVLVRWVPKGDIPMTPWFASSRVTVGYRIEEADLSKPNQKCTRWVYDINYAMPNPTHWLPIPEYSEE